MTLPRLALPLIAALLLALAGTACRPADPTPGTAAASRYHCPMHPTYVSDRQGDCPICNMRLVPIRGADTAAAGAATPAVPGRALIHVPADKQQLIGLRTSTVRRRELAYTLRTTGTLEHDETSWARVAPRFGGWVRTLHVNFTGQPVAKGQPLLTVYSPELFVTEREYLLAYRQFEHAPATGEARAAAQRLLDAARQRLRLWDIGDEEIRSLEQRGEPADERLLRAPVAGHVVTKTAVEGRSFMAGDTLYELADLSRVWVRASVFEYELPRLRTGLDARVQFPHLGATTRTSVVAFIYPHIAPQTRRAELRIELDNPDHALRPDMWAHVEIDVTLGERLSVPLSAVIDTGTRLIAFVRRADDHLEPRDVSPGVRTEDYIEVMDGLQEGEKVVTRALFLVDSESQLKAALAAMAGDPGDDPAPPAAGPSP